MDARFPLGSIDPPADACSRDRFRALRGEAARGDARARGATATRVKWRFKGSALFGRA